MSADIRIGSEIAGYRIERLLGRGGMGVVYLAEHTGLRRKAALKLLPTDLGSDEIFRRRFIRESQLAASIDHPNIIQIYDAAESDGVLYIAMRYVDGSDLAALIKSEGALEFARTISILTQVGDALDAAHGEGLVHRDVKPANILIAPGPERDQVFLSDFGLTKLGTSESHLTSSGEVLGTIDYMAPEQIEGKSVDGRADQYSLGCVAYECLTGRKPYVREAEAAVLWAHVMAPVPSVREIREIPEGADAVIGQAMAKAPEERFASCREFVTTFRDELPDVEGAMPAFVRARRRRRGLSRLAHSWPARIVAAVLTVALGLGVFFAVQPSAKPIDLTAMANVVAGLDPASGSIQKGIQVGAGPSAVAVAGSTLWVANKDDGRVQKVDPNTGKVTTVGTTTDPVGLAVGEGKAWVLGGFPKSTVDSFDLRTGNQGSRIDLGTNSEDIAVGAGSVWVTDLNHRKLLKIDPRTQKTTSISTPGIPTGVAVGLGSVWVTVDGGNKDELLRLDPKSGKAIHIALKARADSVAVGSEGVWVANGDDDSITRIDPATNKAKDPVAVGLEPVDVSVGDGAVWVADQQGQEVSRVDPSTGAATTVPMGLYPSDVTVGAGKVWVTGNTNVLKMTLDSQTCPLEVPATDPVTCGYLPVPERHSDPGGRTTQIFVEKLDTTAKNPPPDPVAVVGVDLGQHPDYPGSSPLPARTGRVTYSVDLRGEGYSKPSLACPEAGDPTAGANPNTLILSGILDLRLRDPATTSAFLDAVARCRQRLVSRGIDLGAYNVREAAFDLEDLRRALGIRQWNLRSLGYTSRVAFEVMRDFPAGVRATWFDSPEYPQDDFFDQAIPATKAAIDALSSVCKQNASCHQRFPDVAGAFSSAVAKLNAHPVTVTVKDPILTKGQPVKVLIDGDLLARQVREDMAAGNIPQLPADIYAALQGRFGSGADSLALRLVGELPLCAGYIVKCTPTTGPIHVPLFSLGARLSMLCHDEAPFFTHASQTAADPVFGEAFGHDPFLAACRIWNVGSAGPASHAPLRTSIPVLIFHGQFDPYYPFFTAKDGTRTLRNSFVYEATGLPYNVLPDPCINGIRNAWVNNPAVEPDVSCLSGLHAVPIDGFDTSIRSY